MMRDLVVSRRDYERGSASAELAGVIVVAVIILLILIGSSPVWGHRIDDGVQAAICRLFGKNCDADESAEDDRRKPDEACVVSETSRTKTVRRTVIIDVKGGGRIQVRTMSDGTYQVSTTGMMSIGYGFGEALGGRVIVDGKTYGAYASASIGAELGGEGEITYTVSSVKEKDKLVSYLQAQVDQANTTVIAPPVGFVRKGWDWLTNHKGTRTYQPPKPSSVTVQAGAGAEAQASGALVDMAVSGSVKGGKAIGTTFNAEGTQVVYYQTSLGVDANGNVSVLPLGVKAGASGAVQGMVAVTLGKDGNPSKVSLVTEISGNTDAAIAGVLSGRDQPIGSASGGSVYEHTVDMTDPRSAQAGYALLGAAGIEFNSVCLPSGGFTAMAVPQFIDAAMYNDTSTVTRREVSRSDNTDLGMDVDVKIHGIGVGGGYSDQSSEAQYDNGQYWNGKEWKKWDGC